MARIKKRGLDYFPLDTDFITHRTVRRLMKREGDGAVGILVWLFSCIYADKGYYLEVDDVLLEDIAADFYGFTDEDVRRVVEAAVDCGIFDAGLYERRHILTSAHIQQQFAFVKKKARESLIDPDLSLLTDGGEETEAPKEASVKTERMAAVSPAEGDISPATDPHSIAKKRTAEQRKPPPVPPRRGNGKESGGGTFCCAWTDGRTEAVDAGGTGASGAACRRGEAQLPRSAGEPQAVPHPARRAVCHHLPEQLRCHRAQCVARLLRPPGERREDTSAGALPAQPEDLSRRPERGHKKQGPRCIAQRDPLP